MEWLEPWEPVDDAADDLSSFRQGWESELKKELSPAHVLYGVGATLIARRYDSDDALFQLSDGRVAKVHLTWKQMQEVDPRWPETEIFACLDDWAITGQRRDHADWTGDYPEWYFEQGT